MRFRPRRNSITSVLLALVLASLFSLAPATHVSSQQQGQQRPQQPQQQPSPQEPVARIETELVQIDVVVTGKDGKPVGDLKQSDFQILEDGKPQEISFFAVGTNNQPAQWLSTTKRPRPGSSGTGTSESAPAPLEQRGRYVVFAVDDYHLSPSSLIYAKQTLHKFVRDQLSAGDQAAIATTSGTLGLLQQFTNDRSVLARAVDRLRVSQAGSMTPMFDVPQLSDYQAELIDSGDYDALEIAIQEILRVDNPQAAGPSGQAGTGGTGGGAGGRSGSAGGSSAGASTGGMSPREIAAQRAKSKARMMVMENVNYTTATLVSIESIVRNLRDLPGRKLVVLVSDGFFLGGASASRLFDLRRIIDAATRAGVVIYSLDARGLVVSIPGGDASQPSSVDVGMPGARARIENSSIDAKRDGMNALARDTGGFLILNTNDLNAGIQRVLDENSTYYVLAWAPESSYRDGRFRKIEVKVPGRPELKVRTRKGYFSPDDKEKEEKAKTEAVIAKKEREDPLDKTVRAARQEQIRAGLKSLFPVKAIPIDLTADFVDMAEAGPLAIVTAHVDASSLTFSQPRPLPPGAPAQKDLPKDAQQALLDVVTLVFDEKGKVAGNLSERLNLNLAPRMLELVKKNGFTYRKLVPLKQTGFHQVRLAIREDVTGLVGSATKWVEVPDLKPQKLTLSSLLLTTSLKDVGTEGLLQYEPRPTQALREFKAGTDVDFLVFTYFPTLKDGKTDLVIQTQIFSGSKLIYSSPLSRVPMDGATDPQRLPYAARLSLEGFDPGDYEMRVVVIDRSSKQSADRRANFSVIP